MSPHWTGLVVVGLLLVLLFGGRGKISGLMGDLAQGITAFRTGLRNGDDASAAPDGAAAKALPAAAAETAGTAVRDNAGQSGV